MLYKLFASVLKSILNTCLQTLFLMVSSEIIIDILYHLSKNKSYKSLIQNYKLLKTYKNE